MEGWKRIIFPISGVSLYKSKSKSLPYEEYSLRPRVDTYFKRSNLMVSFIRRYVPAEAVECLDGSGGMFLWVRLQVEYHPQLYILSPEENSDKVVQTLIGEKIMVAPSSYFKTPGGPVWSKCEESRRILVKLSFASCTLNEMEDGGKRFARRLRKGMGNSESQ